LRPIPKGFNSVALTITLLVLLGAASFVPPANSQTIRVVIDLSSGRGVSNFTLLSKFPMTVTFSTKGAATGSTFFWEFGDGTNSTDPAPIHTYDWPCVYDVTVRVTGSGGAVANNGVVLGGFDQKAPRGGALAVCPPSGTAGLSDVSLAGAYFSAGSNVSVMMNGAPLGSLKSDSGGAWILNITGSLVSGPNGSLYSFATFPASLTREFTTVEGIRVTPTSGAPGTTVTVTGSSYPADASVGVSLGNVSIGTAQTDGSGSFQAQFVIPATPPLTVAGTYAFTTDPPILGTSASFTSSGAVTPPPFSPTSLPLLWLIAILVIVVLVIIIIILLWRGRRRR